MTGFEQMSLFDFLGATPKPEEKKQELKVQDVSSQDDTLPDLKPLQDIPSDATLLWRSYSLACYELKGRRVFTLLVPADRETVKAALSENGIDTEKSWQEIMPCSGIKTRPVKVFGTDERVATRYGETGNIKGRYALRPVCPICQKVSDTVKKEAQDLCGYDCDHVSRAIEIVLPDWKYAQHVFECL